MRTLKFTLQYDGSGYVGWQRQATGASIQSVLEDALAKIEGRPVVVHGAGRTDAGVHALGQVASAEVESSLDDGTFARAMNANLPDAIRVVAVETVANGFHARFSATGKTYEYRIWNGPAVPPFIRLYAWQVSEPLAVDLLQRGAEAVRGTHDFAAFQGTGSVVHTTVRTITSASWHAGRPDGLLVFEITGEGFLRHMVRSLVGTLVEAGLARRPVEDMTRLLASPDRSLVGRTAPAHGLFLMRVDY
jgi:tRNA pseudouridine38-40 synthase